MASSEDAHSTSKLATNVVYQSDQIIVVKRWRALVVHVFAPAVLLHGCTQLLNRHPAGVQQLGRSDGPTRCHIIPVFSFSPWNENHWLSRITTVLVSSQTISRDTSLSWRPLRQTADSKFQFIKLNSAVS